MENKIEKDKFEFIQQDEQIFDSKFQTKPVGYYKDVWRRFKKNKASVVAACIILALILFSLFVPLFAPFPLSFNDSQYSNMLPKNKFLSKIGISTAVKDNNSNERGFYRQLAIGAAAEDYEGTKYNHISVPEEERKSTGNVAMEDGIGTEYAAIKTQPKIEKVKKADVYYYELDTYKEVGFVFMTVTVDELNEIIDFENSSGRSIIYPMVDSSNMLPAYANNANYWYAMDTNNPILDKDNNFISNYLLDENGNVVFYSIAHNNTVRLRVLYYNYFTFKNGKEPFFSLGTNTIGQDLLVRLAVGIRTSLLLSVVIMSINLFLGTVYGAFAGYYGGVADMVMERIRDILGGMPFIIIVMLFKLHFVDTGRVGTVTAVIFSFITLGWIGMAGLVRRQFYRFKSQEYVLAARTLGAGDLRIMTKHIFPNGIGTIITSTVLAIPGFVFSESSLAYLKIIDISGPNAASLGAMLASGQSALADFPHIILWPSIVISLLMLSFNLFGNGLRDAFNPTLRGSE